MNTKIFRGLKCRKALKRAQREWTRVIRALHPSNPHRASVSPWRAHGRYVRAQNRAARAAEHARGVCDDRRIRFGDLEVEVTEEHIILEEPAT